jgi:hypothetical protein
VFQRLCLLGTYNSSSYGDDLLSLPELGGIESNQIWNFIGKGAGQSSLVGSPSGDGYSLPQFRLHRGTEVRGWERGAGISGLALKWDLKARAAFSICFSVCHPSQQGVHLLGSQDQELQQKHQLQFCA